MHFNYTKIEMRLPTPPLQRALDHKRKRKKVRW